MPKILVIEDMPESADLAAQILRRYGHEVLVASDADTGLDLAAEFFPDLIICDYWLPDLDARAFLKKLRKNKKLKDIKVVVCTASFKQGLTKGKDHFDGFISKPYRLSSFMQAVEQQLS